MMLKVKRRKRKNEGGQAIIEFLIVSTMILTMIFVFVQMAWGIAYGHYVHYATFMASRAYLSSGLTTEDQRTAATSVLRSMLKNGAGNDIIPFVAKARTGGDRNAQGSEPVPGATLGTHPEALGREKSRSYSWAEGVQYNFNLKLFLLPLSGAIVNGGKGKSIQPGTVNEPTKAVEWKGFIPFTSDSFLGREPTRDECFKEMTRISTTTGISRADGLTFIEDNGC